MTRFIAYRVLGAIPIALLVTIVAFLLIGLSPGDPAQAVGGEFATPDQLDKIRAELGLDQNVFVRYWTYLTGVLALDFGGSVVLRPGQDAMEMIFEALPITLSLSALSLVIALLVAVPLGVVAALRRDGLIDHALTGLMSFAMAVPPFVAGPLLVAIFAISLPWFPAVGYAPLSDGLGSWVSFLILPAIALSVNSIAEIGRQVRGSMIDVLDQSYIRTAEAKGLSSMRVIGKHAGKNAAIPLVTVLGLQVSRVIGGTVVVEIVFAMPGLGSLAVNAVRANDFPVIQALVLFSAMAVLVTNLAVDLSYGYLNPRLRKA